MKRVFTATCLAATFAVGLAAQSTGTSGSTAQDPQTAGGGQRAAGPRTVTGCLRAGDTAGTYMLTDVQMQGGGAGGTTTGGSTAGSTTTGGGSATGTTGAGSTTAANGQRPAGAPTSIMLTPDSSVDLKAHVGHKIEVTGTVAGGRNGAGAGGATGATTTGAGTTTTGGSGTGTAAGTGTAGAAGQTASGQGGRGPRNMTVTSVRMISESCS